MIIIARYLWDKYKGTYRVKAYYDIKTNDYPREKNGEINKTFDDLYIPCSGKAYIMHHEKNILIAVIPTMNKGNNIIKRIYEYRYGENTSSGIAYEDLYNEVIGLGGIVKIETSDKEMLIYFKNDYMDTMALFVKPQINGAKTVPFSTKNLPKGEYSIPEDDMKKYKNITSKFKNPLQSGKIVREFCKQFDKADMKLQGLSGIKYIHYSGKFDEFLEVLKKEVRV